jgi:hypothetical protein
LNHRLAAFHHTLESLCIHFKHVSVIKKSWMQSFHGLNGCFTYDVEVGKVVQLANFRVFGMLGKHRLPDFGGVGLE